MGRKLTQKTKPPAGLPDSSSAGDSQPAGGLPCDPIPFSDEPVPGWWPAFLLEYVLTNNVRLALANLKGEDGRPVSRSAVNNLVGRRPELKAQLDAAAQTRADMLRRIVWRAATEGLDFPVKDLAGNTVGTEKKWNARLLIRLCEAELPEWKPQRAADGVQPGPTTVNVNVSQPSVTEAARTFVDAVRERAARLTPPGPGAGGGIVVAPVVDRADVSNPGGGRPLGAGEAVADAGAGGRKSKRR